MPYEVKVPQTLEEARRLHYEARHERNWSRILVERVAYAKNDAERKTLKRDAREAFRRSSTMYDALNRSAFAEEVYRRLREGR